ncbi:MAG: rhodanese-like domain-containing protein [Muribaculaceae bacterium]
MKRSIFALLSCLMGALGGCNAADFTSITPQEFQKTIADTTVQVLDARTPDEFAQGHIARAVNIDVLQDDFKDIALKQLSKQRTVAVYCRSGRRSKQAAKILSQNGYRVVELNNGYLGWTELSLPVVKN